MKIGSFITYVDPHDFRHQARVTAVLGSGASGYKMLDLEVAGRPQIMNVPHANDRVGGRGYWLEIGDAGPVERTPLRSSEDTGVPRPTVSRRSLPGVPGRRGAEPKD